MSFLFWLLHRYSLHWYSSIEKLENHIVLIFFLLFLFLLFIMSRMWRLMCLSLMWVCRLWSMWSSSGAVPVSPLWIPNLIILISDELLLGLSLLVGNWGSLPGVGGGLGRGWGLLSGMLLFFLLSKHAEWLVCLGDLLGGEDVHYGLLGLHLGV